MAEKRLCNDGDMTQNSVSKSSCSNTVWVQVPPPVLKQIKDLRRLIVSPFSLRATCWYAIRMPDSALTLPSRCLISWFDAMLSSVGWGIRT